ncbi:MAG: alpha/beta hydrolase [Dehalococcoidia bacterium]|nr:alpha/beta hydrolase [Dehalococcoidia bacterium]
MRKQPLVFLAIAVAALFAAVAFPSLDPAAADGRRYLDEVFQSLTVTRDIPYGQALDHHGVAQTLYLDLYEPAGDIEPLRAALVWVHGGNFNSGDKAGALDVEMSTRFAKRGYVVVSINHRIRPEIPTYDPPEPQAVVDAQHDAQAAVRWLRANAVARRVDPERIVIAGYSSGGTVALLVNYNAGDAGESGNPGHPSGTSRCAAVGGWIDVSLIETGEPPALIVHGTLDAKPFVPYSAALAIVERAEQVGVTAEFRPVEGVGHGLFTDHKEEIVAWMADFFYRGLPTGPSRIGGTVDNPRPEAPPEGDGGGMPAPAVAGIAAAASGGAAALAAAAWYARRRRPVPPTETPLRRTR